MSHNYYKLYYHLIWTTKNRLPIITSPIEEILKNFIVAKAYSVNAQVLEIGIVENHLHMLVSVPPVMSVSEFVDLIKGGSSRQVNACGQECLFYWQNNFGVLSVSEKDLFSVGRYVHNQKQHHKNKFLINEFEMIEFQ